MQIPADRIERILEGWPVARLVTLRPDGAPHVVPIVFTRHGGRIWSAIDGKPKRGGELARVRHIRRDPRVSLLLDRYTDDWSRLWWVRIEGRAEIVQPPQPADPVVSAVVEALRRKYPGYAGTPVLTETPTLLAIDPARVRSWCAGPEAIGDL